MLAAVEAAPETVQDVDQEIQAAVQDRLRAGSEIMDCVAEVTDRQDQAASNLLEQAPQYLQAIARSNRILAHGAGTIALEWFGLRQERLLKNLDGMNDLLTCRSMPDFVSLQSSLVRQNAESTIRNSQRIAQISAELTQEATQTIMAQPGPLRPAA